MHTFRAFNVFVRHRGYLPNSFRRRCNRHLRNYLGSNCCHCYDMNYPHYCRNYRSNVNLTSLNDTENHCYPNCLDTVRYQSPYHCCDEHLYDPMEPSSMTDYLGDCRLRRMASHRDVKY